MKKQYITPKIVIEQIEENELLVGSGNYTNSNCICKGQNVGCEGRCSCTHTCHNTNHDCGGYAKSSEFIFDEPFEPFEIDNLDD